MVDITIQGGFPKGAIMGIGALMLLTIGIAGSSRMLGLGHIDMGPTTAVESLNLNFKDLPSGGVLVTDADSGKLVSNVLPTTGGFLRGIMRALVRDHDLQQKPAGTSFRLTQWADGRLSIADPATNESFELEAFGHTNEAVFASFFNHPMAKFTDMGDRIPN